MDYRKGGKYKYVLNEPQTVYLAGFPFSSAYHPYIQLERQTLTCVEQYAWDGPSGPTIDTDTFMLVSPPRS